MLQALRNLAPALLIAAVVSVAAEPASAQERVRAPRLRAALHELREAKASLKASRDDYPPGYRERALSSIDTAMKRVMKMLDVRNIDDFRGVDRNADYYKRYKDRPRLRAAVADLRDARDELRGAKDDFGDMKEEALDDIDIAVGDILVLIRTNRP